MGKRAARPIQIAGAKALLFIASKKRPLLGFERKLALAVAFIFTLTLVASPRAEAGSAECRDLFASQLQEYGKRPGLFKRALFTAALAAGTLTPLAAALAGGFSGTGGGGGIATFRNPLDAQAARDLIKDGKPLPAQLLARAKIQPLERWEMERNGIRPFTVKPGATLQEILKQAMDNLRLVSPIVARRLEKVNEWMEFAEWEGTENLPVLDDAKPNQPLNETDVFAQLAIRLSAGNNKYGQGPALDELKIKVLFNKKLFKRLDPFDQAILVFHEQLYALAQSIGHTNSNEIRPLVQIFFSEYCEQLRERSQNGVIPAGLVPMLKVKLIKTFGDYPMYFSKLDAPTTGSPRSADRHFSVFVRVIRELRESMSRCLGKGHPGPVCAERSMDELMARPDLSEEESFVFMTFFFLERKLNIFNSESIMDETKSAEDQKRALETACKLLQANSEIIRPRPLGMEKALSYCR